MSPTRIYAVTSRKGGVGKSTVCAGLALFLAKGGHRTLVVDCDFGMRNQDLFFGLAEKTLFDLADVALARVAPDRAAVAVSNIDGLYVCPAPNRYTQGSITKDAMKDAISRMAQELDCAYVLLDTPGAQSEAGDLAIACADAAIIVSTLQPTALRAAMQTNQALQEAGVTDCRLILNGLPLHYPDRSMKADFIRAIDQTSLQLLGIIPYDERLSITQADENVASADYGADTLCAFSNIVGRMEGENVPLFTGFRYLDRNRVLH